MVLLRTVQSLLFFLFLLDLLFLGAGVNIYGLDISSRKLLFLFFCASSLLVYFGDFTEKDMVGFSLILAGFLFILIWVILIPLISHGNLIYAVSDAMPLIASGVFLLTTKFPIWKNLWLAARGLMLRFLYLFTILHVILYFIFMIYPNLVADLTEVFALIFDIGTGNDAKFVFFTSLDGDISRIYFGSSFLLLIGFYFLLSDEGENFGRSLRSRFFFAILLVVALWATNTRSLLLGAVAMVIFFPISRWLMKHINKSWLTIFLLIILPLFLVFLLIPTVDMQLLAFVGLDRDGSDDIRSEQLYSLLNTISENILFGLGFGANALIVRNEDAPYSYELSILALFMKIGVSGVLVACGIWASILLNLLPKKGQEFEKKFTALYALYISFVISCFYNPYIFGFFGTFFLLFILYEFAFVARGEK